MWSEVLLQQVHFKFEQILTIIMLKFELHSIQA